MLEDGEGVDEILARCERLANPLERCFNDGHDLIPVIRDINAKDNLHNRSRKRAGMKVPCQTSRQRDTATSARTGGYARASLKASSVAC